MNATAQTTKPISLSFVVQEERVHKVFVYLDIPELKVKRSFLKCLKFVPSNGHEQVVEFQSQSFTFTINIQTKLYSISIARLPGSIQPEHCSIKYQRGGCWITLTKLEPIPWMISICDDYNPGLDIQENNVGNSSRSLAVEEVVSKDI